jgi:hypothetical protein
MVIGLKSSVTGVCGGNSAASAYSVRVRRGGRGSPSRTRIFGARLREGATRARAHGRRTAVHRHAPVPITHRYTDDRASRRRSGAPKAWLAVSLMPQSAPGRSMLLSGAEHSGRPDERGSRRARLRRRAPSNMRDRRLLRSVGRSRSRASHAWRVSLWFEASQCCRSPWSPD